MQQKQSDKTGTALNEYQGQFPKLMSLKTRSLLPLLCAAMLKKKRKVVV